MSVSRDIRPLEVERVLVGYAIFHERADDPERICGCSVYVRKWGDTPQWQVAPGPALTLSPSVVCRTCGAHGFVANGEFSY